MPASKPRKKKSGGSAARASRSGNPAVRRVEKEAAQKARRVESAWSRPPDLSIGAFIGDQEEALDHEAMEQARADAEPIIADLVAADQSVSSTEDELCRRLGRALAAQDARNDAHRKSGRVSDFETYSPEQFLDALAQAVAEEAFKVVPLVDKPAEQRAMWRLLLAVARIVPHPDSRIPVGAVEDLREGFSWFPEASIVTTPADAALWSRDVYGTRFAITAPFTAAEGPDRWYLWDIDVCSGEALTVGAGYFTTAEQAFGVWRSAVGPDATSRSQLEPVSDTDLVDRLLPVYSVRRLGGESEPQYAEFHRSCRLAQDLRESHPLGDAGRAETAWPDPEAVQQAWMTEFATWRAEHRPGMSVIPDDFPADGEPLDEAEVLRELAFIWSSDEFPDLAHACSPHRIAMTVTSIRDIYDGDFADVLIRLTPDLTAWLTERTALPRTAAEHLQAYADRVARPDADLSDLCVDPMAQIRE